MYSFRIAIRYMLNEVGIKIKLIRRKNALCVMA